MTVADLIAALQALPPTMLVKAVNGDCCGCGYEEYVSLDTTHEDGTVVIVASYSDEKPSTGDKT